VLELDLAMTDSGKRCLWCGGETTVRYHLPRIVDHTDHSRPCDIRWCAACDFGFLDPRPTSEDLDRLNNRAEDAVVRAEQVPSFLEKVRFHLAWRLGHGLARQIDAPLIHSVAGKPSASVCVFGCEEVGLMVGLKDLGHQVLGVERSANAVSRGRDRGIDVLRGAADAPPKEVFEASFDAVFLNRVLSGCLEPRLALQNAHRLLKPDGHLFAEVPNHNAYMACRAGPAWSLCDAGRNVNFLTGNSLSRFVESTSYNVKDMFYRQIVPQFSRSRMVAEQEIANRIYGNRQRLNLWNAAIDPWARLWCLVFQSPPQRYEIVAIIATKQAV
jgi:SAM-dependent methyltransferase